MYSLQTKVTYKGDYIKKNRRIDYKVFIGKGKDRNEVEKMEIIRAEYEQMNKRRQGIVYTEQEKSLIKAIKQGTILENRDNISRTHAYKEYYLRNCEIRWSFLASMVSRNAGWNMTDLEGKYYPKILPQQVRKRLFLTYERANWYIFSDAYPQLLLYEESKQAEKPLFHLLKAFSVSVFMEAEWERYWYEKDDNRLMTALIINEQQMIQRPVIEHPFFQKHVFHSLLFKVQELFHFSSVLFPTIQGKLYGFSVSDFERLSKRVELGKRLAWLLFCPRYQEGFQRFSDETVHTGSRRDYEQYFPFTKEQDTPYLRDVFPVIPHQRYVENDWYNTDVDLESLFSFEAPQQPFDLTDWFMIKQKQLHVLIEVQDFF